MQIPHYVGANLGNLPALGLTKPKINYGTLRNDVDVVPEGRCPASQNFPDEISNCIIRRPGYCHLLIRCYIITKPAEFIYILILVILHEKEVSFWYYNARYGMRTVSLNEYMKIRASKLEIACVCIYNQKRTSLGLRFGIYNVGTHRP